LLKFNKRNTEHLHIALFKLLNCCVERERR